MGLVRWPALTSNCGKSCELALLGLIAPQTVAARSAAKRCARLSTRGTPKRFLFDRKDDHVRAAPRSSHCPRLDAGGRGGLRWRRRRLVGRIHLRPPACPRLRRRAGHLPERRGPGGLSARSRPIRRLDCGLPGLPRAPNRQRRPTSQRGPRPISLPVAAQLSASRKIQVGGPPSWALFAPRRPKPTQANRRWPSGKRSQRGPGVGSLATGAPKAAPGRVGPSQTSPSASVTTQTSPPDPAPHEIFNGGRIRPSAEGFS